jgi:hypothetical protein
LIEVYKNTRIQLEKVFCLEHKTTRHSPPKMKVTFTKLAKYMEKHQTHVRVAGRTTDYTIPNSMGEGQHIMMTKKKSEDVAGDVEMDYEDGAFMEVGPEEDTLMAEMDVADEGNDIEEGGELEVEDDGDLDSL